MRDAIEEQRKIQTELRLEYVDVIVSYKFLNFLDPPVSSENKCMLRINHLYI